MVGRRLIVVAAGLLLVAGCSSPEAHRARGGGPGADLRNVGPVVEIHGGSQPYYATPCVADAAGCAARTGPTASESATASRSGAR